MKTLRDGFLKALLNIHANISDTIDKFFDGLAYGAGATIGVFLVLKYVIVIAN